jgi:hypothetical protein
MINKFKEEEVGRRMGKLKKTKNEIHFGLIAELISNIHLLHYNGRTTWNIVYLQKA